MAKRRKSSVPFSVESLREEAFAEGRNELIGSKILTDISSINLDQVEHVAEDVVLCALIVKFGIYIYIYSHKTKCLNFKGCGRLWVVDGQWKLMFAHCMMKRKVIFQFPNIKFLC